MDTVHHRGATAPLLPSLCGTGYSEVPAAVGSPSRGELGHASLRRGFWEAKFGGWMGSMWTSRLFWKIFLVSMGLNVAAICVFGVFFQSRQEQRLVDQTRTRLRDAAMLLRSQVSGMFDHEHAAELQALSRELSDELDLRITLTGPDGGVLADSHREPREMDNLRNRPEMAAAIAVGTGFRRRVSQTMGEATFNFAVRADEGGRTLGLVRVATPVATMQADMSSVRRRFWTIAALIFAVALGVSFWLTAQVVRPVIRLNDASVAIAKGDYLHRVYVDYGNELGQLGESFNQMIREMADREDQLRATGQRLATVLGGMVEGVIAVDADERVLFANGAAAGLFGFSAAAAVGKPFLETLRNHSLHAAVSQALASAKPLQLETELGGARQLTLRVHATPIPGSPCPGVVLVLHDITDLRRLEQVRQEFVANVSHELKTPLSSIKAYAETLRTGALYDQENNLAFVSRIEEQAERLHELILDVLALAKIESGEQAFDMGSVSLPNLVEDSVSAHRDAAASKQIDLVIKPDLPNLNVWADAEGVRQIVDNLIDNAVKYSPEGGRVTVAWRSDKSRAILDVTDTGIGIALEHQARIFERFYRVDKARSRELGGTGLGLSIVKHLARAFGGAASVKSKPGQGSTFSVELPLA
jgi:two-component system phosphate regulon sensor histidine kinase PhoR